jgi:hypothetical protein
MEKMGKIQNNVKFIDMYAFLELSIQQTTSKNPIK